MSKIASLSLILAVTFQVSADTVYNGRVSTEYGADTYYYLNQKGLSDMLTEAQKFDASLMKDCNCRVSNLERLPEQDPGCRKRYRNFYKNKTVNFKIVLGYTDLSNGYSLDPLFRAELRNMITNPRCPRGAYACGFRQERRGDDENFVKTILGPDNKPRTVRITLVNSSASTVYSYNKANPWLQDEQSQHAEDTFYDFCNTELSMYLGHFRHGCGPGFTLPTLNANSDPVNSVECANHSFDKMGQALNRCQPKLLSTFACSYSNAKQLYDRFPKMGYQRPATFTYFPDWAFQVAGTLNGLMGQVCEPAFSKMVNPPFIDPKGRMSTTHF